MVVEVSFLVAVVMAGLAALVGETVVQRSESLKRYHIPAPILGGLSAALLLLLARAGGYALQIPRSGYPVDFLIALLTTNMGLHVSPQTLKKGYRAFLLFIGAGAVLYFFQLALSLVVHSFLSPHPLRYAIAFGPMSFVGVPYNLNPPSQTDPLKPYFTPHVPDFVDAAQGAMMVGVLTAGAVVGLVGTWLFRRANEEPPRPSASERSTSMAIWDFATRETALLVLILTLIAAAFGAQQFLLDRFPVLEDGYIPVIVLSYLFGATFRMLFESVFKPLSKTEFPEKPLTVLLLGPTMQIVLTYVVMSVPLHKLSFVTLPILLSAALSIGGSMFMACLLFPVFERILPRYYAAVVSTVFLAVTTGFGPMAMSYLHRFTDEEGPVKPMPVILPLNAFFLFPWMVTLLSMLLIRWFG